MPSGFAALERELDLWAAEGRQATFWWRDDDASEPTPALAQLLDLSDRAAVEVAVAVIPARAEAGLGSVFEGHPRAVAVQHGYAHKNHARPGAPAIECGGERPAEEALTELRIGRGILDELFGHRFRPILAAPWNHFDRPVLDGLRSAGFDGASALGPRRAMATAGLAIANAHVDPLNWRERRFAGREKALSGILGELSARRTGAAEPDEPLGILTHHLGHDADTWAFLEQLFSATAAHPAACWLSIAEAFAAPVTEPAAAAEAPQ